MGIGRICPGGTSGFFWKFLQGGLKVVKFVFYHSKRRKRLFTKFFKFLPLFRRPCLCAGKVRATPLKNWCNSKRINIIPNSEILLNLIRKMKCLTDQFQLRTRACFVYLCHRPHFSKLLTRALFFVPCQCSYKFIQCLAFRFHVAGDLNKTISFEGVLSFARALLGLIC